MPSFLGGWSSGLSPAETDRRLSGNGGALEHTRVVCHGLEAHVFQGFGERIKPVAW